MGVHRIIFGDSMFSTPCILGHPIMQHFVVLCSSRLWQAKVSPSSIAHPRPPEAVRIYTSDDGTDELVVMPR